MGLVRSYPLRALWEVFTDKDCSQVFCLIIFYYKWILLGQLREVLPLNSVLQKYAAFKIPLTLIICFAGKIWCICDTEYMCSAKQQVVGVKRKKFQNNSTEIPNNYKKEDPKKTTILKGQDLRIFVYETLLFGSKC